MYKGKAKGTIAQFEGKDINPPISFVYEWDAFGAHAKISTEAEYLAGIEEAKAANKMLDNEALLLAINNKQKNNARQKANDAALEAAGYEKATLENSVVMQLKTAYKAAMASGRHTEESARKAASALVGAEWPE